MDMDIVEEEHETLLDAYMREPAFRSAISACDDGTDFTDSWCSVKGCFEALHRFCGGLASVFPGTSQVESDFSVLKDEKDIFRAAITDLSLESVLHSKQFDMLSVL